MKWEKNIDGREFWGRGDAIDINVTITYVCYGCGIERWGHHLNRAGCAW